MKKKNNLFTKIFSIKISYFSIQESQAGGLEVVPRGDSLHIVQQEEVQPPAASQHIHLTPLLPQ